MVSYQCGIDHTSDDSCLNPCCSGRWSRTAVKTNNVVKDLVGLNPCCSGRWSRTVAVKMAAQKEFGS